jgi:integrase
MLKEQFGTRRIDIITKEAIQEWRQEVKKWHHSLKRIPYEANRRLALLRHMFSIAYDEFGWIAQNYMDHLKLYKEKKITLKLTEDILFKEIYTNAEEMLKRAIMLAWHFTQHENEVKKLRWSNFDFERKITRSIRQKTDTPLEWHFGNNNTFCAYVEYLKANRKELSPYIICHASRKGWQPYASFKTMWHRALKKAGLFDILYMEIGEGKKKKKYHYHYMFKEIRHLSNTVQKRHGVAAEVRMAQAGHRTKAANEKYDHTHGELTAQFAAVLSLYGPTKF